MSDKAPKQRRRPNAFERAQEATLAFDVGWWTSLSGAGLSEVGFSPPTIIRLGDDTTVIGGLMLDRRIVTYRVGEEDEELTTNITRPVMTRFSALPVELLESIARQLLAEADAEWRDANIESVVNFAQSFDATKRLDIAREMLGPDANEDELNEFSDQLKMPDALLEGGGAAAEFFDQHISTLTVAEEDGEEQIVDAPPEPGRTALLTGEWDYFSPEDLEHYGGPESDGAYAFRIVRLCEAIRHNPDVAIQLAVHLGAVTREWEIWRENEEFLRAGRAHFAQQSNLAKARGERSWMTQVRNDLQGGIIGTNIAQYARKFKRERRDLNPPGVERIRNFVSELRRADPQ